LGTSSGSLNHHNSRGSMGSTTEIPSSQGVLPQISQPGRYPRQVLDSFSLFQYIHYRSKNLEDTEHHRLQERNMTSSAELRVSSLFNFSNHVVLVTGGATGLGEMAAQGFVQNGAKVFIASRKESELKKTSDRLNKLGPGTCEYIIADLKDKAGCDGLVKEVKKRTDRLTVLVNNVCVHLSARLCHSSKCLICSRLPRYNFLIIARRQGPLGEDHGMISQRMVGTS